MNEVEETNEAGRRELWESLGEIYEPPPVGNRGFAAPASHRQEVRAFTVGHFFLCLALVVFVELFLYLLWVK